MEPLGYVLYALVKFAAYASWCYAGVRLLDPGRPSPARRALWLGLGRLILGVGVGLFIYLAALSMNNATRDAGLTYAAIYIPVRIAEWAFWHLLVGRRFAWRRSLAWIAGGVVVSCLADVPLGLMEGGVVPVGRPFC